jgi:membrane protein DedA with SNARE-associated domain
MVRFNWDKLRGILKRWEYIVGILGILLTVGLALVVILYWEDVRALEHYGYLGAFLISVFGGATILVPVPMTPVVFALGTVMAPSFAPYLGPVFVGAAAGLGETIGGLSIYMTGYGGGTALHDIKQGKIKAAYTRMLRWVEKRGSLTLFALSAVLNPFFYPAALAAGALRFGVKRFFLICWAGKTIKGITVAAAGYWGLGAILRALGVSV